MAVEILKGLLEAGVEALCTDGLVPTGTGTTIELGRPARPEHGEFATNLALTMAGAAKMAPRKLAEELVARLPASDLVAVAEVAGPGFINFHLSHRWLENSIRAVAEQGVAYGHGLPKQEKVQIEFVSANPTGPLHVGSGRNAAYGDALARLLAAAGYQVTREYYINDAGRQMDRFGTSLHARYLQALGREAAVPEDGYHGDYLTDLGKELATEWGEALVNSVDQIQGIGRDRMVALHKQTLERFNIRFDNWVSETGLHRSGQVASGIDKLRSGGHTFEADGALWFRSSALGASRDQVLVRSDEGSTPTYLGSDVAYLLDKIGRGFDRVIYVWGADHHGNVAAMQAVASALGIDRSVEIILHQMVNFVTASGEVAKMAKRAGQFVTLDQLIDEVGTDAARFTLLSRTVDATIDFNLDLVKSESPENPVYYVQYQHARTCSILRSAGGPKAGAPAADLSLLIHGSEEALIRKIGELPELVNEAASFRGPHRLAHFAQALASQFSVFYRDCRVLSDDAPLTAARLELVDAARQALANTMAILGVDAPESM